MNQNPNNENNNNVISYDSTLVSVNTDNSGIDAIAKPIMQASNNEDRNIPGSQYEPDLHRDVIVQVKDEASSKIRIIGQNYGEPASQTMSLQDYFRKPVLIGSWDWTTATAVQTLDPYPLWEALTLINSKFGYYNKRSYNLKISISLAASPYHVGAACVDWNPCSRGALTSTSAANLVGSQRRHVILTPDISFYELAIPHFSDTPYITGSAASATSLGILSFYPYSALARCDGVAPGTVKIVIRAWTEDMVQTEPSFLQTMKSVGVGGPISTAIKGAAAFAKTAGNVLTTVESVASLLGFTVESDTKAKAVIPRNNTCFANVDGDRPTESLTAYSNNMITPMEDGSGLGDPLTIKSLTSRKGIVSVFTFDTTATTNTVLLTIPVGPTVISGNPPKVPTPLAMTSALFRYWTGSIDYTVTIYSSPLQQGAILVTHEPSFGTITNLNDSQAAATTKACILDLSTTVSKTIRVSASSGTNELLYTKNFTGWDSTTVNPFFIPSSTATQNYHAGQLSFICNKPLIAPGASKCVVVVEISAGPDFQLIDYEPVLLNHFRMTMLSVSAPVSHTEPTVSDIRQKKYDDIRVAHSGEEIISLRAMLNRPHPVQFAPLTNKGTVSTPVALLYQCASVGKTFNFNNFKGEAAVAAQATRVPIVDLYNWVSSQFARRSGGIRYSISITYRPTSSAPQLVSFSRADYTSATNSFYDPNITILQSALGSLATGKNFLSSPGSKLLIDQARGGAVIDIRDNSMINIEDTPVGLSPFLGDTSSFLFTGLLRDLYLIDTAFIIHRSAKPDTNFYEYVGCPILTAVGVSNMTQSSTANSDGTIV